MQSTNRILFTMAAFVLTFGLLSLSAQEPAPGSQAQQKQSQTLSAEGQLARVNLETHLFWVNTADNKELQFSFNDETQVVREGQPVEGLDTMTGSQVKVEYRAEGQNAIATRIEIQSQQAKNPPAPAPDQGR